MFRYYSCLLICMMLFAWSIATAEESDNEPQEVYQLEPISVTPGLFSLSGSPESSYLISKIEMERLPLVDNDIYRSVHNLPGVVADDFSARFALRGGARDEVVTRLDGMELYDPYHLQDFGGAISIIDMGIIQNADLLTGGFPAEYGDVLSGVFDVTSSSGQRDRIVGDVGIDMLNTHAIFSGPISEGSWLLSVRRGYIDLLMGLIESDEVFKPSYYDIYGKFTHSLGQSDELSTHILYAGDSNEIDQIGDDNDLKSHYRNGMLWAKWHHLMNPKAFWSLYLFFGKAGQEKYEGIDGVDERRLSYAGLKGDITYSPLSSHTFKTGWRLQNSAADYDYFKSQDQVITSVDASPAGWNLNGYAQDEWEISRWLAGNMGLRCIYQTYGGYFEAMPRAALATRLRKDLVVRAAYGIYDQPIQVTSLPVESGVESSLPPERATHIVLASEYSPRSNFLLRVEAYRKDFNDLSERIVDYGRKEQSQVSPKSGSAKGLELFMKHAPTPRFTWELAYALSKSEVDIETGRIPRDSDRRHSLALSANYAIWKSGWINAMWRYHSGDPYTEAAYKKIPSEDGSGYVWEKTYGPVNGKRYPPYHSLDVRLTKNFRVARANFTFYLQVLNLYNRKNVHEYAFEETMDEDGQVSYERVVEHFLPLLPTLGLSAKF